MNSEPLSDLQSNKRGGWRVIDAAIKTLNAFQLLLCNQAISKLAVPIARFYLTTTCINIAQCECYMLILVIIIVMFLSVIMSFWMFHRHCDWQKHTSITQPIRKKKHHPSWKYFHFVNFWFKHFRENVKSEKTSSTWHSCQK